MIQLVNALACLIALGCASFLWKKGSSPYRNGALLVGALLLFCVFTYFGGEMFDARLVDPTLEHYPFRFTFDINFRVKDNSVIITHIVKNTDNQDMYFSIGAHPAFNCPLNDGESFEDYFV